MNTRIIYTAFITILILGCAVKKELVVSNSDKVVAFEGRTQQNLDGSTELYWPGSSVSMTFEGSEIYAILNDEKGENYYNVILDNEIIKVFQPSARKEKYLLASGLSKGIHHIQLFKKTEFTSGKTTFYNFVLSSKAKVLPKQPKKRHIEFYGNSITAGHGIDDVEGTDSGNAKFYNNYLAYGALTARYFDASYYCICKGGIGLMISWFPYTMPDIYKRVNPLDKESTWDFAKFTPDIVVVNLFQNDSWLIKKPNSSEFKAVFGNTPPTENEIKNAYKLFIASIRKQYPKAHIICALGNMDITKKDSPWPRYVQDAITDLNDSKVHELFFPYKETKGHPNKTEQEAMSKMLIKYIEDHIKW